MTVDEAAAYLRRHATQCPSAVTEGAIGVVLAELERLGRRHEEDRLEIHRLRDELHAARIGAKVREMEARRP